MQQQQAEKKQMYRVIDQNKDIEFEKKMKGKNPENKQYLICIASLPGSGEPDEWVLVTGRRAAYDKIRESIDYINLEESFILVESCTLKDRKSIYAFMKYVEIFYNEGFDIDDYVKGDWSEDYYQKNNDIDQDFLNASSAEKFSMENVMNGDIIMTSLEGGDE